MIVSKMVVLNQHEPAPLSFRAPLGMETRLNLAFVNNTGAPYSSDLAAQLQLTGRSSARTTAYLAPATDIANGQARAVIPGSDLSDSNGYRLRLLGTLSGEPTLLAVGTVMPIPSAGMEAVPDDTIDAIDIVLTKGRDAVIGVKLWDDTSGSDPFDLTEEGAVVSASVYAARGGAALMPFAVTVVASNEVSLTLSIAQVDLLPPTCWWSLVVSNSAGAHTLCEGNVTVKEAP